MQRAVTYVGFGIAAIFLIVILLVAFLFLVPGSSLGGVSAVTRATYITYSADTNPDVADLLNSRNIIIQSNYIDVEVRVRRDDQYSEGSIQVWENATGLTFNSVTRTHVTWEQVIVVSEDNVGEVFYRIVIHEPSGIISRSGKVYINLFASANVNVNYYNFILDTGRSNVTFASDDTDDDVMEIGELVVRNSSGTINFPNPVREEDFRVNIQNIDVRGNGTTINKPTDVNGSVNVRGNFVTLNLGNIGGSVNVSGHTGRLSFRDVRGNISVGRADAWLNSIVTVSNVGGNIGGGNVALHGNIDFSQRAGSYPIEGNLTFIGDSGRVDIAGCSLLVVDTANAIVTVRSRVNSVRFDASGTGSILVNQISSLERMSNLLTDQADFAEINAVHGAVNLQNVFAHVNVDTRFGRSPITVSFSRYIELTSAVTSSNNPVLPHLEIKSFDGAVNISNIVGFADITVYALGGQGLTGGAGTVNAHFRNIVTRVVNIPNFGTQTQQSRIRYLGATRPTQAAGNIVVTLYRNIAEAMLLIENSASGRNFADGMIFGSLPSLTAVSHAGVGGLLTNGGRYNVNNNASIDMGRPELTISTSNTIQVRGSLT